MLKDEFLKLGFDYTTQVQRGPERGVIRATITVVEKATGKVETLAPYELDDSMGVNVDDFLLRRGRALLNCLKAERSADTF